MARKPLTFRQRDVTAAIRAAMRAGKTVKYVTIKPDGMIVLDFELGETTPTQEPAGWNDYLDGKPNEWDEVLRK